MPDLKALDVYYWTATLRSFSAAANKCGMTQSAVSQRISALENEFGSSLLLRNNKSVDLTTKGIELLTFAERFVRLQCEMNSAMNDKAEKVESIRLGCVETIAYTWLDEFVCCFNTLFPFVSMDITINKSSRLRHDLQSSKLDLALMLGPNLSSDLTEVMIGRMTLAWVSSPKLNIPIASCAIEDIARQMVITYQRGTLPYEFIKTLLIQHRTIKPRLCGNGSLTSVVKMICNGSGVGLIPIETISTELETGKLQILETTTTPPTLDFVAAYNNGTASDAVVTAANMARNASHSWLANHLGKFL